MPAAAVIPAPIAYIKVVAVKKLVVEFQVSIVSGHCVFMASVAFGNGDFFFCWVPNSSSSAGGVGLVTQHFYFEKIRVFKAGFYKLEYLSME